MQSKKSVEIYCRVFRDCLRQTRRTRNGNRRSQAVVRLVAMRHNDVECVRRTSLKEANESFALRNIDELSTERGAAEKTGTESHRNQGECPGF
jgi:hypothetical protein